MFALRATGRRSASALTTSSFGFHKPVQSITGCSSGAGLPTASASAGCWDWRGFMTVDLREFVADFVTFGLPGLSIEQNVGIVWAMVLFWGFAWPWCLIVIHKGPLRRLVERIIREVDAQVVKP